MPTVRINGTDLFFCAIGSGTGVPLVILHGGPALDHSYLLDDLVPLSALRRLYFVDLRGCGRSGRPPGETCVPEQFVKDLEAFRQFLGEPAVDVLGHSMGGLIAQLWAIRYPGSIGRLILVGSGPRAGSLPWALLKVPGRLRAKVGLLGLGWRLLAGWLRGIRDPAVWMQAYWEATGPFYAGITHPDPTLGRLYAEAVKPPLQFLRPLARAMAQTDLRGSLGQIRCPTLVVCGCEDGLARPHQEDLAQSIPHASLAWVPIAGHNPFRDAPEFFRELVEQFLQEVKV